MIEIKNLTKKIGNNQILNDISFSVKTGEILGFLGPNGAGK
ncbi:MAG TPA: ATP-binding cassette domain-containing protein, partial [Candidatus Nanoarchaeia archaeon]|nr:ATP-binding cassette domain-containing protein [Candidatus Nanoarchaeia archaeon]